MCTFNLAIDDELVNTARKAFPNEKEMTLWLEKQVSDLLDRVSVSKKITKTQKIHRHDALRGILKDAPDLDYKRIHLDEKYGI